MSRPRRNIKPQKYDIEESDDDQELKRTDVESVSNLDAGGVPWGVMDSDDESSEVTDPAPLFAAVPNPSEVLQTRSFIVQQTAAVALLQEQFQEQKRIANELEEKLKRAQNILFVARASIAPLNRVPLEVLALIFTIHVRENQQSPWLLTQVSRFWRAAALSTRAIWGAIVLVPSNWTKTKRGGRVRIHDGMEVCWKRSHVIRALARAGTSLLDLKIMFTPGSRESANHDTDLMTLLNWVATNQPRPRLRSLNITTNGMFTLLRNRFSNFDFSGLVSLVLDSHYPEVIEKAVAEAKGLHTLHVSAMSFDKMGKCAWWHQLEDFAVDELYDEEMVDRLRSNLSTATNLTSLKLGFGRLSPSGQTHTISLPSLKYLQSYAASNLWTIECPNLTHLSLHVSSNWDDLTNRRIHLPYLVEMVLDTDRDDIPPIFHVPSLITLDLRTGWSKAGAASVLKRTWPAPKTGVDAAISNLEPITLHFRNSEINPKIFARSLAGRKVLEELFTIDAPITEEFFDNLLPMFVTKETKKSKGVGSKWQVPCLALRRLLIDLVPRKNFVKEKVLASAKELVAMRLKAGVPLERAAIRFSKDDGWEELVDTTA